MVASHPGRQASGSVRASSRGPLCRRPEPSGHDAPARGERHFPVTDSVTGDGGDGGDGSDGGDAGDRVAVMTG